MAGDDTGQIRVAGRELIDGHRESLRRQRRMDGHDLPPALAGHRAVFPEPVGWEWIE